MAKHNSKILKSCNCQKSKKDDCPIPGAFNQDGVVHQTTWDDSEEDNSDGEDFHETMKKLTSKYDIT